MKQNVFQWSSLKARVTLFTVAIFILSFFSLAYYGSWMLRDDMQRQLSQQQFSTVSLLAEEINRQLAERLNALQLIAARVSPDLLADRKALGDAEQFDFPQPVVCFSGSMGKKSHFWRVIY